MRKIQENPTKLFHPMSTPNIIKGYFTVIMIDSPSRSYELREGRERATAAAVAGDGGGGVEKI